MKTHLLQTMLVIALVAFGATAAQAGKQAICHFPPENPGNWHTITVSDNAVATHVENHGDFVGSCADDPPPEEFIGVTPTGSNALVVFMANGIYDPTVAPPTPKSGDYFDSVIMGRDATQKAAQQQEALDYFVDRFGVAFMLIPPLTIDAGDLIGVALDPTDPDGINNAILLVHGYQDQRWQYLAHLISGEGVGPEGRPVHEASYSMLILAPATVHGTWGGGSGTLVDAGTVGAFGEYLIEHPTDPAGDLLVDWKTQDPIFDAFNPGGITFDYTTNSTRFGDGVALGRSFQRMVGQTGLTQRIIRNVINFPAPPSLQ